MPSETDEPRGADDADPVGEAAGAVGADATAEAGPAEDDTRFTTEILAALAYGEQLGAERARRSVDLAPDARSRSEQAHIAELERANWELVDARVRELGGEDLIELVKPYFDSFFVQTEPHDWVEAQTFHYVGDALVADFADELVPLVDRVSGEVVRRALRDRDAQEGFALDELQRALREDPESGERIAEYSRLIVGEALTQTSRALEATTGLRSLLGGAEAGKRFILTLLDRHRQRLDRLGIEPVEPD